MQQTRFRLKFEKVFKSTVLEDEEANQDLHDRICNDEKFAKRVLDWYLERMYHLFRSGTTIPPAE